MGVVATNFCCVFPTLNDVDVNESCKDRDAWERNDTFDTLTNISICHHGGIYDTTRPVPSLHFSQ